MRVRTNRSARRGQVLAQYGIVLALVALVFTGLAIYIQRGLQGGYKAANDSVLAEIIRERDAQGISEANMPLPTNFQYEPYYNNSEMITSTDSEITDSYAQGGVSTKTINRGTTSVLPGSWRQEVPLSDEVVNLLLRN